MLDYFWRVCFVGKLQPVQPHCELQVDQVSWVPSAWPASRPDFVRRRVSRLRTILPWRDLPVVTEADNRHNSTFPTGLYEA